VEIPYSSYSEFAYAKGDLMTSNMDISSPIGGHYELRIFQVSGEKYMEIGIVCLDGKITPGKISNSLSLLKIPTTNNLESGKKV
jgi:hypothetical protein